jgi:membrane-associated protease RseP (regulator of RpoE activity)
LAEQSEKASQARPVSIIGIVLFGSEMTSENWSNLVSLLIVLNIFLGVFNLIPLLPFDGGHVAIAVYEKAQELRQRRTRRYMADISRMLPVAYGVIMVLVLLFVATAYLDVTKGVGS